MFTLFFAFIGIVLYFLPTIAAYDNKKVNFQSIFIVNTFLGWTLIGWVVALAWAVSVDRK